MGCSVVDPEIVRAERARLPPSRSALQLADRPSPVLRNVTAWAGCGWYGLACGSHQRRVAWVAQVASIPVALQFSFY